MLFSFSSLIQAGGLSVLADWSTYSFVLFSVHEIRMDRHYAREDAPTL